VTYEIPEGKGHLVQDKRFYEALRADSIIEGMPTKENTGGYG
jgi:hypothetical protein